MSSIDLKRFIKCLEPIACTSDGGEAAAPPPAGVVRCAACAASAQHTVPAFFSQKLSRRALSRFKMVNFCASEVVRANSCDMHIRFDAVNAHLSTLNGEGVYFDAEEKRALGEAAAIAERFGALISPPPSPEETKASIETRCKEIVFLSKCLFDGTAPFTLQRTFHCAASVVGFFHAYQSISPRRFLSGLVFMFHLFFPTAGSIEFLERTLLFSHEEIGIFRAAAAAAAAAATTTSAEAGAAAPELAQCMHDASIVLRACLFIDDVIMRSIQRFQNARTSGARAVEIARDAKEATAWLVCAAEICGSQHATSFSDSAAKNIMKRWTHAHSEPNPSLVSFELAFAGHATGVGGANTCLLRNSVPSDYKYGFSVVSFPEQAHFVARIRKFYHFVEKKYAGASAFGKLLSVGTVLKGTKNIAELKKFTVLKLYFDSANFARMPPPTERGDVVLPQMLPLADVLVRGFERPWNSRSPYADLSTHYFSLVPPLSPQLVANIARSLLDAAALVRGLEMSHGSAVLESLGALSILVDAYGRVFIAPSASPCTTPEMPFCNQFAFDRRRRGGAATMRQDSDELIETARKNLSFTDFFNYPAFVEPDPEVRSSDEFSLRRMAAVAFLVGMYGFGALFMYMRDNYSVDPPKKNREELFDSLVRNTVTEFGGSLAPEATEMLLACFDPTFSIESLRTHRFFLLPNPLRDTAGVTPAMHYANAAGDAGASERVNSMWQISVMHLPQIAVKAIDHTAASALQSSIFTRTNTFMSHGRHLHMEVQKMLRYLVGTEHPTEHPLCDIVRFGEVNCSTCHVIHSITGKHAQQNEITAEHVAKFTRERFASTHNAEFFFRVFALDYHLPATAAAAAEQHNWRFEVSDGRGGSEDAKLPSVFDAKSFTEKTTLRNKTEDSIAEFGDFVKVANDSVIERVVRKSPLCNQISLARFNALLASLTPFLDKMEVVFSVVASLPSRFVGPNKMSGVVARELMFRRTAFLRAKKRWYHFFARDQSNFGKFVNCGGTECAVQLCRNLVNEVIPMSEICAMAFGGRAGAGSVRTASSRVEDTEIRFKDLEDFQLSDKMSVPYAQTSRFLCFFLALSASCIESDYGERSSIAHVFCIGDVFQCFGVRKCFPCLDAANVHDLANSTRKFFSSFSGRTQKLINASVEQILDEAFAQCVEYVGSRSVLAATTPVVLEDISPAATHETAMTWQYESAVSLRCTRALESASTAAAVAVTTTEALAQEGPPFKKCLSTLPPHVDTVLSMLGIFYRLVTHPSFNPLSLSPDFFSSHSPGRGIGVTADLVRIFWHDLIFKHSIFALVEGSGSGKEVFFSREFLLRIARESEQCHANGVKRKRGEPASADESAKSDVRGANFALLASASPPCRKCSHIHRICMLGSPYIPEENTPCHLASPSMFLGLGALMRFCLMRGFLMPYSFHPILMRLLLVGDTELDLLINEPRFWEWNYLGGDTTSATTGGGGEQQPAAAAAANLLVNKQQWDSIDERITLAPGISASLGPVEKYAYIEQRRLVNLVGGGVDFMENARLMQATRRAVRCLWGYALRGFYNPIINLILRQYCGQSPQFLRKVMCSEPPTLDAALIFAVSAVKTSSSQPPRNSEGSLERRLAEYRRKSAAQAQTLHPTIQFLRDSSARSKNMENLAEKVLLADFAYTLFAGIWEAAYSGAHIVALRQISAQGAAFVALIEKHLLKAWKRRYEQRGAQLPVIFDSTAALSPPGFVIDSVRTALTEEFVKIHSCEEAMTLLHDIITLITSNAALRFLFSVATSCNQQAAATAAVEGCAKTPGVSRIVATVRAKNTSMAQSLETIEALGEIVATAQLTHWINECSAKKLAAFLTLVTGQPDIPATHLIDLDNFIGGGGGGGEDSAKTVLQTYSQRVLPFLNDLQRIFMSHWNTPPCGSDALIAFKEDVFTLLQSGNFASVASSETPMRHKHMNIFVCAAGTSQLRRFSARDVNIESEDEAKAIARAGVDVFGMALVQNSGAGFWKSLHEVPTDSSVGGFMLGLIIIARSANYYPRVQTCTRTLFVNWFSRYEAFAKAMDCVLEMRDTTSVQ